ncbi:hypothetical protein B0T16DRAFT_58752 [Cercophora newfieldiana]|uniref:Uncharacterized protein n=1 Tax=Cercophora newfieldiana TaxID=92897 RepID=A0AA39YST7_9PEZI|nr:hypothetical protein B0T16DRAFT_58752 [Cercophora newfieldiana]
MICGSCALVNLILTLGRRRSRSNPPLQLRTRCRSPAQDRLAWVDVTLRHHRFADMIQDSDQQCQFSTRSARESSFAALFEPRRAGQTDRTNCRCRAAQTSQTAVPGSTASA